MTQSAALSSTVPLVNEALVEGLTLGSEVQHPLRSAPVAGPQLTVWPPVLGLGTRLFLSKRAGRAQVFGRQTVHRHFGLDVGQRGPCFLAPRRLGLLKKCVSLGFEFCVGGHGSPFVIASPPIGWQWGGQ